MESLLARFLQPPLAGGLHRMSFKRLLASTLSLILALLFVALPAMAADYYISPTGSDSHGCTNKAADACASFVRCAAVMSPGDTCFALGGIYTTSGPRGWSISGSGGTSTARKTFRGQPGETAVIRPNSYMNNVQEATINLADSALDYVTFSDLTIYGRFRAAEALQDCADYVTLERIVFKCPGAMGTGNTVSVMTANQQDEHGWTPRDGWILRDNLFTIDSSCPDYCPIAPDGPSFIHFYSMSGATIINNDFRLHDESRSCLTPKVRFGVWFKGRSQGSRVSRNYCNGDIGACVAFNTGKCPAGFNETCDPSFLPYSSGDNRAFQNVSDRSGSIGWDSNNFCDSDMVYNNTVYRPRYDGITASPSPGPMRSRANNSIFNNIVVSHPADSTGQYYGYLRWTSATDADGICTQQFIDFNMYHPVNPAKSANFSTNGKASSTLEAWRSFLAARCAKSEVREVHSRVADPAFVSAQTGDFHLQSTSPARMGGRGNGWPSVLGAYVDGDEIIGCTFDPMCHASGDALPPVSAPPNPVHGVLRTDAR